MNDLYQPCPCHHERKLKFCCGKEVISQLTRVVELMDGGQRIKAGQALGKAIEQHGYRDCLTTIQFAHEVENRNLDAAEQVVDSYRHENGQTGVYWTMKAILGIESGDLDNAIDHLQSAIETAETPSSILHEAALNLALQLARTGNNIAARDYFGMYSRWTNDPNGAAAHYLRVLRQSLAIPAPLKHDWPLVPIPEGRPWSVGAAQALHWAEQGLWRKALHVLEPLAHQYESDAILWKNVAILAGRLNRPDLYSQAWKRYAQCPGVHPDHLVEAEMISVWMNISDLSEVYEESLLIYDVNDLSGLMEQIATEAQFESLAEENLQPLSFRRDETPKAFYYVPLDLDNHSDKAEAGADSSAASGAAPAALSHEMGVALYGKRTDREAQMVIAVPDMPRVMQRIEALLDKYPQIVRASKQTRSVGQQPKFLLDFAYDRVMGLRRVDRGLAPEQNQSRWEDDFIARLPNYRTQLLGGKSFAEAAADPAWKTRVEALLLTLECEFVTVFDVREAIQRARETLGLPRQEKINPKTVRLQDLSLQQFSRLDFSVMPLRMLAWAVDVAMSMSHVSSLRSLIAEIEQRMETAAEEIQTTMPLASIYLLMAKIEGQVPQALQYLERGERLLAPDAEAQADWLVQAAEVAVGRRFGDKIRVYFEQLYNLAFESEHAYNQLAKLCYVMGMDFKDLAIPNPALNKTTTAEIAAKVAAETNLVPEAAPNMGTMQSKPSKLWLPGMD